MAVILRYGFCYGKILIYLLSTLLIYVWTFNSKELFDKAYVLADFFYCFIFSLVEDYFVLFEEVTSFCVDGYDQRSEFFDTAVPQCLRHSEISPLSIYNLFYFCSCYNGISSREYTVDRSEFFTCTLWILQLSMQNSLPLTNVIQRSSIQKTFYSA